MKQFWRELHTTSPRGDNYSSLLKGPAAEAGMQIRHTRLERCCKITQIFAKLAFDFFAAWDIAQIIFSKHSNKKPLVKSDFLPYSLSYLFSLPTATPTHFRDLYHMDLSLSDQREYVMQGTWSIP